MWLSQGSLLGVVLAYLVFLLVVAVLGETGWRWMGGGRLRWRSSGRAGSG